MRVTTNSFSIGFMDQLQSLAARQQRLQRQASTGMRVENPGQDPNAVGRALELVAKGETLTQYKNNIAALSEKGTAAYQPMSALKKISDRAGEIATLADGTKSSEELKLYATEIDQLLQQAVQSANTQHRGAYLFGGTATTRPPFVFVKDPNGAITGVTYQGNQNSAPVPISDEVQIAVTGPGVNATGTGPRGLISDSRTGADFFKHLISLRDNLLAGNTNQIAATDRPALAQDEENLLANIAEHGALAARLQSSSAALTQDSLQANQMLAKATGADLAETLVRLTQVQTAYQAALQSGAKVLTTSLMDFLR